MFLVIINHSCYDHNRLIFIWIEIMDKIKQTVDINNEIVQAALRPEFQGRAFNPDDYELVDGYPYRKDRFKTICTNVAQYFYADTWSSAALKRHLSTFCEWFGQLNILDYDFLINGDDLKTNINLIDHPTPISLVHKNPFIKYCIEHEFYQYKKVKNSSVERKSTTVDIVLNDGSILSGCTLLFAVLSKDGSTVTVLDPEILWNFNGSAHKVEHNTIISIREWTRCDIKHGELFKPFWVRFTKDNLREDNRKQLECENAYEKMTKLTSEFKV